MQCEAKIVIKFATLRLDLVIYIWGLSGTASDANAYADINAMINDIIKLFVII